MGDIDLVHLSRCYGRVFRRCDLVVGGVNRTYRLTTENEAYYLRLYRPVGRSSAEIAFELRLLREFRPTPGIDVARPICTIDGVDCTSIVFGNVPRAACLFQALEGREITYEPEDMALFGSALAKLHNALAGIEGGDVRLLDPMALCARANASLTSIPGSKAVRSAIDHFRADMIGDLASHDLPLRNCHGDAWKANATVQDGTVGFFDFDDCGYGSYLLDLGTAAWHLVLREQSRTETLTSALLSGYETGRALLGSERRALPHYIKLAEIRSLLALAEFCTLEEKIWSRLFDRAMNLFGRTLEI